MDAIDILVLITGFVCIIGGALICLHTPLGIISILSGLYLFTLVVLNLKHDREFKKYVERKYE